MGFWKFITTDTKEFRKYRFVQKIIPKYTEGTLLIMSLSCLGIMFFSKEPIIKEDWFSLDKISVWVFMLFFTTGLILSFAHSFIKRKKNFLEKFFMIMFAVLFQSFIGAVAAMEELQDPVNWTIIFPIINLVQALLLLPLFFKANLINEDDISNENISHLELTLTLLMALGVILLCRLAFKMPWFITLSILLSFSMTFEQTLNKKASLWLKGLWASKN